MSHHEARRAAENAIPVIETVLANGGLPHGPFAPYTIAASYDGTMVCISVKPAALFMVRTEDFARTVEATPHGWTATMVYHGVWITPGLHGWEGPEDAFPSTDSYGPETGALAYDVSTWPGVPPHTRWSGARVTRTVQEAGAGALTLHRDGTLALVHGSPEHGISHFRLTPALWTAVARLPGEAVPLHAIWDMDQEGVYRMDVLDGDRWVRPWSDAIDTLYNGTAVAGVLRDALRNWPGSGVTVDEAGRIFVERGADLQAARFTPLHRYTLTSFSEPYIRMSLAHSYRSNGVYADGSEYPSVSATTIGRGEAMSLIRDCVTDGGIATRDPLGEITLTTPDDWDFVDRWLRLYPHLPARGTADDACEASRSARPSLNCCEG